jgi:acyl-CoA synthetase (AMP-forming)/AMP-acid ligase II
VENALYADDRVLEVAAVGVPDARLGELVAAVVSIKPPYHGKVNEAQLLKHAQDALPKFAVPVIVIIQNEPFGVSSYSRRCGAHLILPSKERTPSGKILKAELRELAKKHWELRKAQQNPAPRL